MVNQEVKLAHELNKRIFPIRVDYDGALPYDLAAYLDKIQYRLWRANETFELICGAIVDGLRGAWAGVNGGLEPGNGALRRLSEVTESVGAPLPSADPRLETGAIKLESPFYVERTEDDKAARLVTRPGETILIKGPRQVGKTSLSARARAAADLSGLPATTQVVVCLDEVDNILKHSYRDSFFGMLRGWHNRRATHPVWNRFNLVIAHSTEPALFIRDLNQSPSMWE